MFVRRLIVDIRLQLGLASGEHTRPPLTSLHLGRNEGSSTKITNLEIIKNVEKLTKIKTKFKLVKRRKGDVAKLSCSINKARNKLNWNPTFSKIPRIIKDEISWIKHLDKLNIKRKFRNYL